MNYLQQNVDNFQIAEYFKSIDAQFRETAESDFKNLISKIGKFEANAKNLPLIRFAAKMRDTRFEVLSSSQAENYWNSMQSASIARKRLQEHLYNEETYADVILDYAKKRHKSTTQVNNSPTNEANEVSSTSEGVSINETNIWQIWSIVISCIDKCDDPETDINEYSLEHLGIIQLGDGISNNTTKKLFSKDLVKPSNELLREKQVNVFKEFQLLYVSFFEAMNVSIDACEELLMRYILRVKKTEDKTLSFCYKVFNIFIEVFKKQDIAQSEILYNYRLIWKLLDATVEALGDSFRFVPGEVRLNAIKSELIRRGFSTSMYYNADGVIIEKTHDLEVALLETSGAYDACTHNKETTDHVKAAYGLLAMLHSAAHSYKYADVKLFKKLAIPFVHVAKKKIRLWTLNLATNETYVLHRRRSCTVPTTNINCKENLMATANLMWELQQILKNVSSTLEELKKSHEANMTIENAVSLESFLAETVDVKLPCNHLQDDNDIFLSSSPLRPDSIFSQESCNSHDALLI